MTVHDWTKVSAGTYHDFRNTWLVLLKIALNAGALPPGYYAQVEQNIPRNEADVLTLQRPDPPANGVAPHAPPSPRGAVAVADAPPKSLLHLTGPAARPRVIAVRHASGHRPVALIELVSYSNKDRVGSVEDFVNKVVAALDSGVHVVVLDLLPAGKPDPQGMPGAVWSQVGGAAYTLPAGKRLTCGSFVGSPNIEFYADPLAPGDPLPETPLFLTPGHYIPLPLGATYAAAYHSVPDVWREVLERS